MAPPPGTLRVGRYFLTLFALMALLYLMVFLPGERHTPKLGLDLVGGQQVIFQARTPNGQTPSTSSMEQAKQIIEDRVNGTGVTEATVVIQGDDQLVVSIPGGTKTDVSKLGAAAKLNFRGVVTPAAQVGCGANAQKVPPSASSSASPTGTAPRSGAPTSAARTSGAKTKSSTGAGANGAGERPLTAPTSTAKAPAKSSATAPAKSSATAPAKSTGSSAATSSAPTAPAKCALTSVAQLKKVIKLPAPNTVYKSNGVSATLSQQLSAALSNYDCSKSQTAPDPKNDYYLACDNQGLAYLLGPVIVPGDQIDTAGAQAPNAGGGGNTEWAVSLQLKDRGDTSWGAYTGAHNIGGAATSAGNVTQCGTSTPCADYVAFTLDGKVISAPVNESAINGQATQITGSFTQGSANDLADQLRYGALPLSFKSQDAQSVSATLGTSQLEAGLLAGGIGLVLVVIYSLIYYRALGLVTIASLIVSGGLTYSMLVVLGKQMGFTLSLAGIAGFIVAVGITADSFVVFFERIKDEVHEGRSLRVAVPRAWVRARRTILSADTVSFLAAAILYYFAAGDVKGFAFTLGLSTILDLVVVFLFTHPLVSLLSRSRAFGSARFTGLNAVRAGGIAPDTGPEPVRPRRGRTAAKRARGGGTAVLDKPRTRRVASEDAEAAEDADLEPLTQPDADTGSGLGVDTATVEAGEEAGTDDTTDETAEDATGDGESGPRRRTTPAAGTAAERAAARRARLREQGDANGTGKGDR